MKKEKMINVLVKVSFDYLYSFKAKELNDKLKLKALDRAKKELNHDLEVGNILDFEFEAKEFKF